MNEQYWIELNDRVVKALAPKKMPLKARHGIKNGRTKVSSQLAGSVAYLISKYPKELPHFFVAKFLSFKSRMSLRQSRRIAYGSRTGKLLPHTKLNELRNELLTSAEKYGYTYGPIGKALSKAARNGDTGVWSRIKSVGLRGVYKFLKQTEEMSDVGIRSTFIEVTLRKASLET